MSPTTSAPPLGAVLRTLRIARGLTQAGLARRLGVSQSRISLFESGRQRPSVEQLRRLHEALTLTPDEQGSLWRAIVRSPEQPPAPLRCADFNDARRRAERLLALGRRAEAHGVLLEMAQRATTPEQQALTRVYEGNRAKDCGEWRQAAACYIGATRLLTGRDSPPSHAVQRLARINLADLHRAWGDPFAAVALCRELLRSDQALSAGQRAFVKLCLGCSLLESGDPAGAREALEAAVAGYGGDAGGEADPIHRRYRDYARAHLARARVASAPETALETARDLRERTGPEAAPRDPLTYCWATAVEGLVTGDPRHLDAAAAVAAAHDLREEQAALARLRRAATVAVGALLLMASAGFGVQAARAVHAPVAAAAADIQAPPAHLFASLSCYEFECELESVV